MSDLLSPNFISIYSVFTFVLPQFLTSSTSCYPFSPSSTSCYPFSPSSTSCYLFLNLRPHATLFEHPRPLWANANQYKCRHTDLHEIMPQQPSAPKFDKCNYSIHKTAHAGSRTRVTSMGGLYDAATLHVLMRMPLSSPLHFVCVCDSVEQRARHRASGIKNTTQENPNSAAGNWTRVFCVTGRNTNHYTTAELTTK